MSAVIAWMAAEGERRVEDVPRDLLGNDKNPHFSQNRGEVGHPADENSRSSQSSGDPFDSPSPCSESLRAGVGHPQNLPLHQFPQPEQLRDIEQERRTYRRRTVAMLRRYMRYSIETGRLPSLLGREWFRAKVTSYSVVTFEDRVIFVHDMEMCLERLDEFSRQIIARHILQEHDCSATARLLRCNEKTVRRVTPMALDLLSDILLDAGLMERIELTVENSCQGGERGEIFVSDCEDGENKF